MSWTSFLVQFGGVAREALSTNFWGLGCPYHCGGSSLPPFLVSLLPTFLDSFAAAVFLSLPGFGFLAFLIHQLLSPVSLHL